MNRITEIRKLIKDVFSKYPGDLWKVIFAQAYHETGGFTSDIFLKANNLFGMKFPKIRPTLAKGIYSGHAYFENIEESVKDLEIYLKYVNFPFFRHEGVWTADDYVSFLTMKGYFTDKKENYLRGVKNGLNYA